MKDFPMRYPDAYRVDLRV